MSPRPPSGLGDRLRWCQEARPEPVEIQDRVVAAGVQKAVLWALVNRSDSDGSSHPSQGLLARDTCFSRGTVNRAIAALASQGFLEVFEDDVRRSRSYLLDLSASQTVPESVPDPVPVRDADQGVREDDRPLSASDTGPVRDADTIDEPPKEPPTGTTQEPSASPTPLEAAGILTDPDRKVDPIWDAVVAWYGSGPSDAERGHWNRAIKALRSAGVSPDEIPELFDAARAAGWQEPFKPMAVAANLTGLRLVIREPDRAVADPALAELRRRRAAG